MESRQHPRVQCPVGAEASLEPCGLQQIKKFQVPATQDSCQEVPAISSLKQQDTLLLDNNSFLVNPGRDGSLQGAPRSGVRGLVMKGLSLGTSLPCSLCQGCGT